MTDVFISYNSSDRERARSIGDFLKGKELSLFVDESYLVPGKNWVEGLESALGSCRSVAVLLGPGGMGKWQKAEVQLALDRHQTQPGFPVVPVLLPGNDDPPTGFLALNTWIDLRNPAANGQSLANLHAALLGQPPAEADFNPRAEVCPYRGLLPFREEDRDFFFGREKEVEDLVSRIRDSRHPVVGITGRSGSGKSSLVYAGLIPELRAPSTGAPWEVITFRPREKPLDELIAAFSPPPEEADLVTRRAHLNERVELLRQGKIKLSELVADVLRANTGSERVLIFVDQWEELYSQARRTNDPVQKKEIEADRDLFIKILLETSADSECTLVFTVRADFYDQVLTNADLTRLVNEHGLSVGPISDEGLRDCIVKPANAAGYRFADGLVDRISSDARAEPGRLPLLEYLLQELWKNRDRDEFTHKGYDKAGGVTGAIAKRAESEFQTLEQKGDPELIRATRRLFVSLVAPGEGREDTRAYIAPPESEPERIVVEHFSSAKVRLITASEDRIEISHEALIRQWTRLRDDWLAKNREILRIRNRVREAMKTYNAEGKSRSRLLPPGKPLEEAKDLLKNHGDVMIDDVEEFVRRSAKKEKKRTLRIFAAVLLVVFALSGLTVWALGERRNANKQAEIAKEQARIAMVQAALADKRARAAEFEEGEAWMERAKFHSSQPGGEFYAAIMAARAIGFEGFGAPRQRVGFPYKVLFPTSTAEYQRALREVKSGRFWKPIWSSPATGHHNGSVSSVALSPDGSTLASGSADNTVKIWDLQTGTERKTLSGHDASVQCVAFSPDARTLASGSSDNTIKLWDLQSGTEKKTLSGHRASVLSVAFSPDGGTLASGGADNEIKLWDLQEGFETKTLSGHRASVWHVAFSPDGSTLASGSDDNSIKIWDLKSGAEKKTLSGHTATVWSVVFSPDGNSLASGSDDKTIKLWDLRSGTEKKTLSGHRASVWSVAFNPDGSSLASGSADNTIKVWDLPNGTVKWTLSGHQSGVTSVAFNPNGTTLGSGSNDKTIKVWDVKSGTERKTFSGHGASVWSVLFSPDGRWLASGSGDNTVKVWDLKNGIATKTLSGHEASVLSVVFCPDGKTLASGSNDNTIKVWDLESGTEKKTLSGHEASVWSVAYSPDGTTLASGSADNTVKIWDLESGTEKKTLSGHEASVWSVAFSPDGTTLASGGADNTIKLWDLQSGTETKTLSGHRASIWSVAFSPNGNTLASGSDDNTIKIWDLQKGTATETLSGHRASVRSVDFSPDGTTLISGSGDNTIKVWGLESATETKTLSGHRASVWSVAFSPDETTLVSGSGDNTIKLWHLESGSGTKTLSGHSASVLSVAFSSVGSTLASGSDDNTIKVWNLQKLAETRTLSGHRASVLSVAFNPVGTALASGSDDNTVKIWDLQSGIHLKTLSGHRASVWSVAFSPDGKILASGSADNTIKLWDLQSGTQQSTLSGHVASVLSVAFSPDGKTLASGSDDNTIKLWDLQSGSVTKTLSGHRASVSSVAFSPDGTTLASGSDDNTVKLWDLQSGRLTKTLSGHGASVWSVAFSPDGKTLASGCDDKTVKLWDLETGTERRTFSGHVASVLSVAFSPDGNALASGSDDKTIMVWNPDVQLSQSLTDLATYLTSGWLQMDGRDINWTTTTNNLYRERKFGFLNVPEDSHIAMIQRNAPASELLWQYSKAGNWNGVLAMVHELTKPEIRKKAVSALTRWLRRNAENKEITPGVADFRLRQLTEIVPEADRSSEPFIETKKAVETYRQQAKKELPEPT